MAPDRATVDNLRMEPERRLVDQKTASWNLVSLWLRRLDDLKAPNYAARIGLHSCSGSGLSELGQHVVQALRGDGLRAVISMQTARPALP